jgi:glycosyltransferase involved in cell wall biosynthesis
MSATPTAARPDTTGEAQSDQPNVSVVIPCLNEAEQISECVVAARKALDDAGLSGEVVVADNDSDDDSAELARKAGARVVEEAHRGYGSAYLAGFAAARGKYIVMADADLTYDFAEIPRFIAALEQGAELVMGNRMERIQPGAMPWHHRYIGNPLLSGFLNLLYRAGVKDAHCGMRGLRRDALPRLDLRSTGMEFASEMVIRAVKEDLKISELDIEYHPRSGESKLSSFRDGWRHLRLLLIHSPTALFIVPGAVMFAIGLMAMALVGFGVQVFGREFSLHAMIGSALLTIVGVQVVTLGLSARAFGVYYMRERPDRLFTWGRERLRLEHGLIAGGLALLAGLVVGGIVVGTWIGRGFGELSEEKLAVFAAVLIIVGLQVIFSSFFLSLLGLRREGAQGSTRTMS